MFLYKISFPGKTTKSYIGITKRSAKTRLCEHGCPGKKSLISHAIRKHGNPNLTVLAETDDLDLLMLLEIEAIEKFNTFRPNGYNNTKGGEGSSGHKLSEKHKEAIKSSLTGRKHSEETKLKMQGVRGKQSRPNTSPTKNKVEKQKLPQKPFFCKKNAFMDVFYEL